MTFVAVIIIIATTLVVARAQAPSPLVPLLNSSQAPSSTAQFSLKNPNWYKAEDVVATVPYFANPKIKVCTTPWTPGVVCDNSTDPVDWTGFEIELFRITARNMGIAPETIEWSCYEDKGAFVSDLYANVCDLGVAGMAPLPDRIQNGLRFSVPSIRSGFLIMVTRTVDPPGMWYVFSAMTWGVWVLMFATGVLVGIIVWLFEVGMRALNADTHNMSNVMWDTLGRPVQMRDYRLSSFPANLTAITWSFLVFIVMVIYSANLTANLTVNQFQSDIHGVSDLPGKAVGTWYGFQDELKLYGVATMGMDWNDQADEVKMINTLKSGLIKALVFDSNLLQIYDATDCDTMLVGSPFDLRDQCVAFSPNLWQNYPAFVDEFNNAMLSAAQGTGGIEELIKRFIKVPPAPCKNVDYSSGASVVGMLEVSGLWVILACSVAVGIIFIVGYRLWDLKIRHYLESKGWLHHGKKVWNTFQTLKESGLEEDFFAKYGSKDSVGHSVQSRYIGASRGYVDGSEDVAGLNLGIPPGYQYRAKRRNPQRSDSAKVYGTDTIPEEAEIVSDTNAANEILAASNNNSDAATQQPGNRHVQVNTITSFALPFSDEGEQSDAPDRV